MSNTLKLRTLLAALVIGAALVAAPRPASAVDLTFGLLGHRVEGICSVVTTTYIAVMDSHQHPHVFVLPPNYRPPQGLTPGRHVKVSYTIRKDGLMVVKRILLLKK